MSERKSIDAKAILLMVFFCICLGLQQFGVGFGVWLLAEPIEPGFTLGAFLALLGIVLVTGASWLRALWAKILHH